MRSPWQWVVEGLWGCACCGALALAAPPAEVWLTDPGGTARFEPVASLTPTAPAPGDVPTIVVDTGRRHQPMEGFGYTLTGGSAMHLRRMSASARAALLRELFAVEGRSIGVSYLRLSIGASDLSPRLFSYNDLPVGETDPELKQFDLGPDREDVIPVLREILAIAPDLGIMASPWSPPAWMKTNGDTRGGSLKPEFRDAYARYLVKYVQAMEAEGIRIRAITVQNEPLHPGNNPSLLMPADEQALFVGRHLGPAFRTAGLATRILCYDHNADRTDYPLTVLGDPIAQRYVDGSAFHLYAGSIDALSRVHEAYPEKHLYFTEQWIGGPGDLRGDLAWHVRHLIVGATRNWCRTVLEWNLAADSQYEPHTDRGGCERCLGALTIDGDRVTRNPAYYIIAHASKFVRPGSVRVDSTPLPSLPNVAFLTPSGRVVVILLNGERSPRTLHVRAHGGQVALTLPAGGAGTLVW